MINLFEGRFTRARNYSGEIHVLALVSLVLGKVQQDQEDGSGAHELLCFEVVERMPAISPETKREPRLVPVLCEKRGSVFVFVKIPEYRGIPYICESSGIWPLERTIQDILHARPRQESAHPFFEALVNIFPPRNPDDVTTNTPFRPQRDIAGLACRC